ncbi:Conserved_hypothetical protein [Hexamita inflata]|uniref:Uncharacterized protein n=1 Tax=Hexamita inflata TaxID=28002 RepID=A0AA86PE73_9EUKA|nr:Conserved hypothetical protein [Hexamita inflata]
MTNQEQATQSFKFNFNNTVKMDTSFIENNTILQTNAMQFPSFTKTITKGKQTEEIKPDLKQQHNIFGNKTQVTKSREPSLFQFIIDDCKLIDEPKFSNPHMLMNVHKLLPDLSLYLQIGLKTIAILDSQMNILSQSHVFGENANGIHGIKGNILKQNAQQYCTVMHKGVIYVQMFNDIYFIQNESLKHLCQIPVTRGTNFMQFNQFSSQKGGIFSFDDQLYIQNQEQIYLYNNGKFKFIKNLQNDDGLTQYFDFYQFGNNLFCFRFNKVYRVHTDLQLVQILTTHCEFEILCVQGGIILISLLQTNEIIAINMITDEVKNFSDVYGEQKALEIAHRINSSRANYQSGQGFEIHLVFPTEIQQLFSLGECGLQLRVELQKQIFGEQFPEKCRVEFEKYMKSQMTEAYIHETIALIKPVREDWKALEEKYTGMVVVEEKEKYLHDCQLLNVMKLAPNLDVYMAVEDGFIHIIDKDRKILHQIKVDYDYYVGKQFSNPDQKPFQSLVSNFVNNIIFHKGSMYVQAFNKVYRIHNTKTELVACLPYLNLDYFKAYPQSVGSDSQHLVLCNELQQQYILNNSKFKLNIVSSLICFNFCGYCCNYDKEMQYIMFSEFGQDKLVFDYELCYKTQSVHIISFCSSGILVMNSEYFETVCVFNMVTQQIKELKEDNRFSKNNIYNNVELGVAGLQLKKEIIVELFGEEAIYKIQEAYENFYKTQTSQYPELENELNSLIGLVKEFPEHNTKTELSCREISKPLEQRSILQKCQLMNVVKLKSDYNIYLAIEDNNMYIFDDQRRIYGQYQVDYDMYAGIYDAKYFTYGRDDHKAHIAIQYNATICNGEIYVRRFKSVYKVSNKQLIFLANIPYCGMEDNDLLDCMLYAYQNKLYAFTKHKVYELVVENNNYIFCDRYSMQHLQYFNFCDQMLIYDTNTKQMFVHGCFQKMILK